MTPNDRANEIQNNTVLEMRSEMLTVSMRDIMGGMAEPLCCECYLPIRWVLDMMSFKHVGGCRYVAGHARCLWTKDGFTEQRNLASR